MGHCVSDNTLSDERFEVIKQVSVGPLLNHFLVQWLWGIRVLQKIYEPDDQARSGENQAGDLQRRTRQARYHKVNNDNTVLSPPARASQTISINLALTHFTIIIFSNKMLDNQLSSNSTPSDAKKVKPPFTDLPAFNVAATIMSFLGY